jgi:hypothetical protein
VLSCRTSSSRGKTSLRQCPSADRHRRPMDERFAACAAPSCHVLILEIGIREVLVLGNLWCRRTANRFRRRYPTSSFCASPAANKTIGTNSEASPQGDKVKVVPVCAGGAHLKLSGACVAPAKLQARPLRGRLMLGHVQRAACSRRSTLIGLPAKGVSMTPNIADVHRVGPPVCRIAHHSKPLREPSRL